MYYGFPNINSSSASLTGGDESNTLFHNFDTEALGGDCLRLVGPAIAFRITGIAGGVEGRVVHLRNRTGVTITLKNEDTGSAAVNRFALGGDVTIPDGRDIVVYYDIHSQRWFELNSH